MQVLRLYILSNVLLGIFCIVLYVCICILNDDISQYSSIYDERSKQMTSAIRLRLCRKNIVYYT